MSAFLNAGQKVINVLEGVRRLLAPITDRLLDMLAGPRVTAETAATALAPAKTSSREPPKRA